MIGPGGVGYCHSTSLGAPARAAGYTALADKGKTRVLPEQAEAGDGEKGPISVAGDHPGPPQWMAGKAEIGQGSFSARA